MRLSRRSLISFAGASLVVGTAVAPGFGDQGLAQSSPEAATGGSVNDRILELASYLPLVLLSENASQGRELIMFSDYAQRLTSVGVDLVGITDPEEAVQQFARGTAPIPSPEVLTATTRVDNPIALFGWSMLQVHQQAFVMSSEGTLTVLKGRFNPQTLRAAWVAEGYQPREIDGISAFSLHEDATIDIAGSEINQVALSHANNVALIDDETLIYASTLPALTRMIETGQGEIESLGASPILQQVVAPLRDPLSAAIVLSTGGFMATPSINFGEGDLDIDDLPPPGPVPLMGLVGFVSGPAIPDNEATASPDEPELSGSQMVASRHFLSAEEAELAARRSLITLESGWSDREEQPWSTIFGGWRVSIDRDSNTVINEIDLLGNERIWWQSVMARDAWFLYG